MIQLVIKMKLFLELVCFLSATNSLHINGYDLKIKCTVYQAYEKRPFVTQEPFFRTAKSLSQSLSEQLTLFQIYHFTKMLVTDT